MSFRMSTSDPCEDIVTSSGNEGYTENISATEHHQTLTHTTEKAMDHLSLRKCRGTNTSGPPPGFENVNSDLNVHQGGRVQEG